MLVIGVGKVCVRVCVWAQESWLADWLAGWLAGWQHP